MTVFFLSRITLSFDISVELWTLLLICLLFPAGADIVMTNSYQASIGGFMEFLDLDYDSSYQLIKSSVDYVKEAIALEATHARIRSGEMTTSTINRSRVRYFRYI